MAQIKRKQIDLRLTQGTTYGTINTPDIVNNDTLEGAMNKVTIVLDRLAPASPPLLSAITLTLQNNSSALPNPNNFYTAKICGTTTTVTTITGLVSPKFATPADETHYVIDLFPTSTLKVNATTPILALTQGENPGATSAIANNNQIIVLEDVDYYTGQVGKEGFWYAMQVQVQTGASSTLTPATTSYTFELECYNSLNILTGAISIVYYVESTPAPTITNWKLTPGSEVNYTSAKKISGVPVLDPTDSNDYYNVQWTAEYVSKYFYPITPFTFTDPNADLLPVAWVWETAPAVNDLQTPTSGTNIGVTTVNVAANKFRQNSGDQNGAGGAINLEIAAVDALTQTTGEISLSSGNRNAMRVDSISVEPTARRECGNTSSSVYNTTALTNYYDTTENIKVPVSKSNYIYELQLEGGYYRYPDVDYSGYFPAGPNYTGISGMRYASFYVGSVTNAKILILNTPNQNIPILATSTFKIYVRIGNAGSNTWQTPWLDAGTAYDESYTATNNIDTLVNGAAALYTTLSTSALRHITLCVASSPNTSYPNGVSGDVYVRIGWSDADLSYRLTAIPTINSTI